LQLFTRHGPDLVQEIGDMGYQIFLDLKLHDIPNTVARAVESIAHLPVSMLTIHASGGSEMMAAAKEARDAAGSSLTLLAVTVLTSLDQDALTATGVSDEVETQVVRLARLAVQSGIPGIVCSPREITVLRRELGPEPVLITPGIRPADAEANDQKRSMTPREAAEAGANGLVIGRPISRASDPRAAVERILAEISTQ